ncbi:hypothetical protein [Bordetella genomosp. 1]|uniref:Uncharacterized protein n=1 Tax=Bordetella genomosp. 1 TaxID=1395607 RepID=A0ABX4EXT3_9BORD|nr:hypothetical protein [Bordetella genomosp. 1]MDQ8031895.1 hypothetical protein [Bordetella sp.]OZI63895.1 hypothetical protein CAL27_14970 [Bordetella genomosp. 1]
MSIHGFNPGALQSQDLGERQPLLDNHNAPGHGTINAVRGQGEALDGVMIDVGDGQQREQLLNQGSAARDFFSALAAPFKAIGRTIEGIFSSQARETRSERGLEAQQGAMLAALRQPMENSILDQQGNGPATVFDKLVEHAVLTGSPLANQPDTLRGLVAMGERLADALANGASQQGVLQVTGGDGQTHAVHSGVETTRALGWYMMAQAALQDVNATDPQATSNMVTSGSIVMPDEGNRIYDFLKAAPTSDARMSTHFNERSAADAKHSVFGFIPTSKPEQRGTEDYLNKLPGKGGTMLFDKLHDMSSGRPGARGELLVKFEHVGCPPFFCGKESHENAGTAIGRFFGALSRNVGHGIDLIKSKFTSGGHGNDVVRQEHVYKGHLKNTVYTPFVDLHKAAEAMTPRFSAIDAKTAETLAKRAGLPALTGLLSQLKSQAEQAGDAAFAAQVQQAIDATEQAANALNAGAGDLGIERRGAEVHISLARTWAQNP